MKRSLVALSVFACLAASICPLRAWASDGEPGSVLMPGMGDYHHMVSTKNADAQRFFDQGLTFVYAFNHEAAIGSFHRAAEIDPQLAMAWWGVALALGPNINSDVDPEREKTAYEAVQKALALSDNAPQEERAYIEALAKRYSNDPKADLARLNVAYRDAMKELVARFPDDVDAATLYAESIMDLRPWKLWSVDGKPAEGTLELVAVLESVLRRTPLHPGANHYYIHTIEASPHPEWALPSADRLGALVPAAGHLVHMPAHIYMRVGDYEAAARCNAAAVAADEAYEKATGAHGFYALMYYNHNLHFLAVSRAFEGRYEDAVEAADKLAEHVQPHVKAMPMIEGFLPQTILIKTAFHRWDDVLATPEPDGTLIMTTAVWHYARGMAYAGKGDAEKADGERRAFLATRQRLPDDAALTPMNSAAAVFAVTENLLDAEIARARGDHKAATESLRKAVAAQDALSYDEPPDWYLPTRNSLGAALAAEGRYTEAEEVFRASLDRYPRDGRALFGLMECLRAQGKTYQAEFVNREFTAAWQYADTKLTLGDL